MAVATERAAPDDVVRPPIPIRIRTLLLIGLLVFAGYRLYPRAVAAWQVHALGTDLADYAACMVGPMGPALLRDNATSYRRLLRRRLVASAPDERPFAECAPVARRIIDSDAVEQAHRALAHEFVEYGDLGPEREPRSLDTLEISTAPLAELSRTAWPFVRGGYTRLMKASARAKEAMHPIALPKPALGSGLPRFRARYRSVAAHGASYWVAVGKAANLSVYETRDGVTFRPLRAKWSQISRFAERCVIDADGRSFTFGLDDAAQKTMVTSLGPDGVPYTTALTAADDKVVGAACDTRGLVAAIMREGESSVRLMHCQYRSRCQQMRVPAYPGLDGQLPFPVDVARLHGTTVVSVERAGIVRTASTRDDGQSWTPFSVAYDAAEFPELSRLAPPHRLLSLGQRVFLYGEAEGGAQYLVLASDDQGASWRTP